MSRLNIAIFGIGALGCLFGAHLARRHRVTLVGHWPEQRRALAAGSLQLLKGDGREERVPLTAVTRPDEVVGQGAPDLALVVVKSYQTEAVAREGRNLPEGMLWLTLQNGLGNREALAETVGEGHIAVGSTVQGATVVRPGVVRHGGEGLTCLAPPKEDPDRIDTVVEAFNKVGLSCQREEDGQGLLWGKVAINAAINPLAALLRMPNGYLLQAPARHWVARTAEEVAAVAVAKGIKLPFPTERVAERALAVCRDTAGNRASMLQDLESGRPTEIDAICGAVVKAGLEVGIATPYNALLWARVRGVEAGSVDNQTLTTELEQLIRDADSRRS